MRIHSFTTELFFIISDNALAFSDVKESRLYTF